MLANMVKQDRAKSSKQLDCEWESNGVECKPSTVRITLNEVGDRACRLIKVPRLSMRKKRLSWTKAHKDWTLEDWKKVDLTFIFLLTTFLWDSNMI